VTVSDTVTSRLSTRLTRSRLARSGPSVLGAHRLRRARGWGISAVEQGARARACGVGMVWPRCGWSSVATSVANYCHFRLRASGLELDLTFLLSFLRLVVDACECALNGAYVLLLADSLTRFAFFEESSCSSRPSRSLSSASVPRSCPREITSVSRRLTHDAHPRASSQPMVLMSPLVIAADADAAVSLRRFATHHQNSLPLTDN